MRPLFPGKDAVEQLVEIFKVLGTPTRAEIEAMNPNYIEMKFPSVNRIPWGKTFPESAPPELIDLIAKMLAYSPTLRISPLRACVHPVFETLRSTKTRLPNGQELPPLFNFTDVELSVDPSLNEALLRRT
jgi:glycogen synthase kinase 3 beta